MGRGADIWGTGRGRRPDPDRRRPVEECAGRLTVRCYRAGEVPADLGPVVLVTTRPHFGGRRCWFACPGCARRVGILYRPVPGAPWRCRRCHGLTYRSAQRADRQAGGADRGGDDWLRKLSEPDLPDFEALAEDWLPPGYS